jgi:hypothetical protein
MDIRCTPASTSDLVHVPLLHWITPPESSTAAQYPAVGHETPVGETPIELVEGWPGSILTGADHDWPFHWRAWPDWSTAMQNAAVGHETPANDAVDP